MLKKIFRSSLTGKVTFFYLIIIFLSFILTAIFSYLIFQKLIDSQMAVIDFNTNIIKSKLEKLYDKNTNVFELPDLKDKFDKKKLNNELIIQNIEKSFPGYKFKIPTVEGTLEYNDNPKLIYDTKEMKYFFEITREIKFSENTPFKSLELTIKFNYYQIILKSVLLGIFLSTIIIIPVIVIIVNTLIQPIIKMTDGARQIASGNLEFKVNYESKDEIGELIKSFNYMSNELLKIKRIRDDLLATISHEIRSPLARIKGYTELLIDIRLKKSEQNNYYRSILQEIDNVNNMVEEIIEISRLELNKEKFFKEIIDLGIFLDKLKSDLNIQKNIHNINYELNYDYNLFCFIDIDKISRVFSNVIDNSIKAKAKTITITAKKSNDKIIINISDDGIGIPQDQLELVFEKFYRIDKSRDRRTGGFGLGLAICKEIIKEHNGNIFFVPVNKGTLLQIELPFIENNSST